MGIDEETARYLSTGDHDMMFAAWPGGWFKNRGAEDLKAALVAEVQRRAQGLRVSNRVPDIDLAAFTRRRIEGMVHGLFSKAEWAIVLPVLERSVVFLTPASIATILAEQRWLRTAWDLANMYLASVDTDVLGPDAEGAVGLSEETTCYVTMEYFDEDGVVGSQLGYVYDFGSSTELVISHVAAIEAVAPKKPRVVGRNEAPTWLCEVCDEPATSVCADCSNDGSGFCCEKHAVEHACGDEMLLPVVNSPRMGVCGYTGGAA